MDYSLYSLIHKQKLQFFQKLEYKLDIVKQLLQGVNLLHEKKYTHRDLSIKNILLNYDGNKCTVKIGDLGSAQQFFSDISYLVETEDFKTQLKYLPPESCDSQQKFVENQKNAIINPLKYDIYFLGCVIYEIVSSKFAYCNCQCQNELKIIYEQLKSKRNFFQIDFNEQPMHSRLNEQNQIDQFIKLGSKNQEKIGQLLQGIEQLIIDCTQYDRKERPVITVLLQNFLKIKNDFEK